MASQKLVDMFQRDLGDKAVRPPVVTNAPILPKTGTKGTATSSTAAKTGQTTQDVLKSQLKSLPYEVRKSLYESSFKQGQGMMSTFTLPSVNDPELGQFSGLQFTEQEWQKEYGAKSMGTTISQPQGTLVDQSGKVIPRYGDENFWMEAEKSREDFARQERKGDRYQAKGLDYISEIINSRPVEDPYKNMYQPFDWSNPGTYINGIWNTVVGAKRFEDSFHRGIGSGWQDMQRNFVGAIDSQIGGGSYLNEWKRWAEVVSDDLGAERLRNPHLNMFDTVAEGGMTDPAWYAYTLGSTLPHVLGSLALSLGTAVVTKNPFALASVNFAYGASMEGGSMYNQMIDDGKPIEQARQAAAIYANISGGLESVIPGLVGGKLLSKGAREMLSKMADKALKTEVAKNTAKYVGIVLGEGLTETAQELASNVTKSFYYDNIDILAGLPEAFVGGMVGGGVFAGAEALIPGQQQGSFMRPPVGNTSPLTELQKGTERPEQQVQEQAGVSTPGQTPGAQGQQTGGSLEQEIDQLLDQARAEEATIRMGEMYLQRDNDPDVARIVDETRTRLDDLNAQAKTILEQYVNQNAEMIVNSPEVVVQVGRTPDGRFVGTGTITIGESSFTISPDVLSASQSRSEAILNATMQLQSWFVDTLQRDGIQNEQATNVVYDNLNRLIDLYGDAETFVEQNGEAVLAAQDSATAADFRETMTQENININEGYNIDAFFQRANDVDAVRITAKEAEQIVQDLASDLGVGVKFVEKVSTNPRALGRFVQDISTPQGWIEIRTQGDGAQDIRISTPLHEVGHAYFRNLLTKDQQKDVLDVVRDKYKDPEMSDAMAEERLVEDMKHEAAKQSKRRSKYGRFLTKLMDIAERLVKWLGRDPNAKIDEFYRNVLSKKRPSDRKKMQQNMKEDRKQEMRDYQKEAFQDPDALTSKYFNFKEIKGKEFVNYQQAQNAVKGAGLKQVEMDIINGVLDTQFKDEKRIPVSVLRDAVVAELVPLEVKESWTYATYGLDKVGMEDWDATTHIFDGPVDHGVAGHFKDETEKLFGHTRVANKGKTRAILEVQSDFFQKTRNNFTLPTWETINKATAFVESYKGKAYGIYKDDLLERLRGDKGDTAVNYILYQISKTDDYAYNTTLSWVDNTLLLIKNHIPLADELEKLFPYQNLWHERMLKEEIRLAAMDGVKTLRIPTPKTLAFIEGYPSTTGEVPYQTYYGDEDTLDVGDEIIMGPSQYIVVESTESTIRVVHMGNMTALPNPVTTPANAVVFEFDGETYYALERDTETLSQPSVYRKNPTFDVEKLEPTQRAVYDFYKSKVNPYFEKLRKGNVEKVTDENGFEWLETKITGEDMGAVEAFQTEEVIYGNRDDSKQYGERMKEILEDITSGNVDYYDFGDMVATQLFDTNNLEKISGGGMGRDVYAINEKLVLKVAKSAKGLQQNMSAGDSYIESSGKIAVAYGKGKDFVISERLQRNAKEVNAFLKPLRKFSPLDVQYWDGDTQSVMEELGLEDFVNYSLLWNDFVAERNWGVDSQGQVKLMDEGALDKDVNFSSDVPSWVQEDWQDILRLRKQAGKDGIIEAFQELPELEDAPKNKLFDFTTMDDWSMEERVRARTLFNDIAVDVAKMREKPEDLEALDATMRDLTTAYTYDQYLVRTYGLGLPQQVQETLLALMEEVEGNLATFALRNDKTVLGVEEIVPYGAKVELAKNLAKNWRYLVSATKNMGSKALSKDMAKHDMATVVDRVNEIRTYGGGMLTEKQVEAMNVFANAFEDLQEYTYNTETIADDLATTALEEVYDMASQGINTETGTPRLSLIGSQIERDLANLSKVSTLLEKERAQAERLRARFLRMRQRVVERAEYLAQTASDRNVKQRIHKQLMQDKRTVTMTEDQMMRFKYRQQTIGATAAAKEMKEELKRQYMMQKRRKEITEKILRTEKVLKQRIKNGTFVDVEYGKLLLELFDSFQKSAISQATLDAYQKLLDLKKKGILEQPDISTDDEGNIFGPEQKEIALQTIERIEQRLKQRSLSEMTTEDMNALYGEIAILVEEGRVKLQIKAYMNEQQRQADIAKVLRTTNSLDANIEIGSTAASAVKFGKRQDAKELYLNLLTPAAVADRIDGDMQYGGENAKLQREISSAEAGFIKEESGVLVDVFTRLKEEVGINEYTNEESAFVTYVARVREGKPGQFAADQIVKFDFGGIIPEQVGRVTRAKAEHIVDIMQETSAKYAIGDRYIGTYEAITNQIFPKVENYVMVSRYVNAPKAWETANEEGPEILQGHLVNSKNTNMGNAKARQAANEMLRPRTDFLRLYADTISTQLYFVHMQPVINNIASVVKSDAYKNQAGVLASKYWEETLSIVAKRGQWVNSYRNRMLDGIKNNVAVAILAFKPSTVAMQLTQVTTGVLGTYAKYGPRAAFNVMQETLKMVFARKYRDQVIAESNALSARAGTAGQYGVMDVQKAMTLQEFDEKNMLMVARDMAVKYGMFLMQDLDITFSAANRQGIYNALVASGVPEAEANIEADQMMGIMQSSTLVSDRPLFIAKTGSIGRFLTALQTFSLGYYSMFTQLLVRGGLRQGDNATKMRALIAIAGIPVANALVSSFARSLSAMLRGEDEQEELDLLTSVFFEQIRVIPLIGPIAQSAIEYNKKGGLDNPAFGALTKVLIGTTKAITESNDKQLDGIIDALSGVAMFTGVPGTATMADVLKSFTLSETQELAKATKDIVRGKDWRKLSDIELSRMATEIGARKYGSISMTSQQKNALEKSLVKEAMKQDSNPLVAMFAKKTKNEEKVDVLLELSEQMSTQEFQDTLNALRKTKMLSEEGYALYLKRKHR